jgi:hypothetical protein
MDAGRVPVAHVLSPERRLLRATLSRREGRRCVLAGELLKDRLLAQSHVRVDDGLAVGLRSHGTCPITWRDAMTRRTSASAPVLYRSNGSTAVGERPAGARRGPRVANSPVIARATDETRGSRNTQSTACSASPASKCAPSAPRRCNCGTFCLLDQAHAGGGVLWSDRFYRCWMARSDGLPRAARCCSFAAASTPP